ncbi:hypothetical protein L3X38_026318 [Prunus dulcis]|uniref:RNase H type-1 domain-containing protein n=1 Tax=Prunus dulcis TaxID=3755 RepID=A0AAD4VMM3_PRUDU|nr:hypothetical protein L3X38_026318 [Prunus dulcis]
MDVYSGYNQIMIHEDDKAKTSFIIEISTYCYKIMPFGLTIARATYQRHINKIFKEQISKTMELLVDGAPNHKGARAGVVIATPNGTLLEQDITLGFPASNNEVEYEALLARLRLTKEPSIKKLAIYSDSQLIRNQASCEYMAKQLRMIQYLEKFQTLLKEFPTFIIKQVPQIENTHADALASLGSALDT